MLEHMLVSMTEGMGEQITASLTAATDGLLDMDPDTLDDTELAAAVVELRRQQARLAAATARLTASFEARRIYADDGSRSAVVVALTPDDRGPRRYAQSSLEAWAAPSARARNLGHTTVGCTSGAYVARDEKPQSEPAITLSRPTRPAYLRM
jgi:hypothetical protein